MTARPGGLRVERDGRNKTQNGEEERPRAGHQWSRPRLQSGLCQVQPPCGLTSDICQMGAG